MMWSTEIGGTPLCELYAFFVIYSFLGWAMESLFVSVSNGKWINRGFLSGPLCPIYGTGAILVITVLTPVQNSVWWLFIGGMVIATAIEYFIAALLEKIFHATWWDYSQMRFNIKGRVCLLRSLEWGVLSVMVMHKIQPSMQRFVEWIPQTIGDLTGILLLVWLIADASVTVMNVFQLKDKMTKLGEARLALREKVEGVNIVETKKEFFDYWESLPIAESMSKFKEKIEESTGKIANLKEEEQVRLDFIFSEIKEKLERREKMLKKSNITERRLAKAFPGLRFKKYNEEFAAFKKEFLKKKRKD